MSTTHRPLSLTRDGMPNTCLLEFTDNPSILSPAFVVVLCSRIFLANTSSGIRESEGDFLVVSAVSRCLWASKGTEIDG